MNTTTLKEMLEFLQSKNQVEIKDLDEDVLNEALALSKPKKKTKRVASQKPLPLHQCIGRSWNDGMGKRCTKPSKIGEYCGFHGKEYDEPGGKTCKTKACGNDFHTHGWQHHGRWDNLPPVFYKVIDCWSGKEALSEDSLDEVSSEDVIGKDIIMDSEGELLTGTIDSIRNGKVHIVFDDGQERVLDYPHVSISFPKSNEVVESQLLVEKEVEQVESEVSRKDEVVVDKVVKESGRGWVSDEEQVVVDDEFK